MRGLLNSVFDPEPTSHYLDRFGWLLLLTYLTIAGQMLVNIEDQFGQLSQETGNLVAQIVGTAMLILALYACGVSRPWRRTLMLIAVLSLVARTYVVVADVFGDRTQLRDAAMAPWGSVALMALTFFFVVYRLSRHRRVSSATLLGAITAYLLIPLVFYYAFLTADAIDDNQFFREAATGGDFMFFSLTTVTTLGYGKPTPATDIGQLLATTEALIGQLYLVVVVALIVGLMASRWGSVNSPPDH